MKCGIAQSKRCKNARQRKRVNRLRIGQQVEVERIRHGDAVFLQALIKCIFQSLANHLHMTGRAQVARHTAVLLCHFKNRVASQGNLLISSHADPLLFTRNCVYRGRTPITDRRKQNDSTGNHQPNFPCRQSLPALGQLRLSLLRIALSIVGHGVMISWNQYIC